MLAFFLRSLLCAGLFATVLPAQAVTVYWPSAAPCNTSLQACIDATPDGNTVSIETDDAIAESLNLYNRSIALVAGNGRRPSLAPGNWISVSSAPILGDQAVTLRGLRLSNSYVRAVYLGTGTATFDFSGLVLTQTSSAPTYIRVEARAGNSVDLRLYDNRVTAAPAGADAASIELVNAGGTLDAKAYFNQVTSTAPGAADGAGIRVDVSGGGGGTVKLHGNTVRGSYLRAGVYAIEGQSSASSSDFSLRAYSNVVVCNGGSSASGNGIGAVVNSGRIHALVYNNTLTRCYTGIFATQQVGGGSGAEIAGQAKNNLIVGERGLAFTAAITTSFTNTHNLLNVASNPTAPGANTITLDAKLVSLEQPRLRPGSPAINSGDNTSLALGLLLNGLPTTDADGLRRFKGGTSNDADIGAYESGDRYALHVARTNTIAGHTTRIDARVLNNLPAESPLATPHWNGSGTGISNNTTFGVYYFDNHWLLFNQDQATPMPPRAAYNLFVPAAGGGSFRHVSSAANSSGYATRMDASGVNNLPERIILVTQNWNAGANVYNAHPVGLRYVPVGSDGRWEIVNLDQAAGGQMPLNAGFNVYAQEASPNAFRYSVTAAGSGLDHPLINNVPCAQLHVTRLYNGTAVPDNFDVYYGSSGRWYIYSYTTAPVGTQYNVVIDPAQVYECADRIFAGDFS